MKQTSTINSGFPTQLISLTALFTGIAGLVLISPKWVSPLFAWLAPAAILFYARVAKIKGKWFWLWLGLVVAGFISAYEVFPMPLAVLVIFTLIDSIKLLVIFLVDNWISKRTNHFAATLVFPAAMVTKEFIESRGGGGVWSSIANTQFEFPWLAQLASVTGLWGITFMIGWFGSVAIWAYRMYKMKKTINSGLIIYSSLLLIVLVYGALRYNAGHLSVKRTVKVAGLTVPINDFFENVYKDYTDKKITIDPRVSPSSSQLKEVNKALMPFLLNKDSSKFKRGLIALNKMYDSLFYLSEKAANAGAKIIVWSEANAFLLKANEANMLQRGKDFALHNNVYLLMAMAVVDPGKIKEGRKFVENKAILLGPAGTVLNVLHKNKPVPLAEQSEPGDQVIPVIKTEYGNISTSICYDADFPGLMKQLGKKETDVLLLPSGDWYSISPYHSYMAAMRGIENGTSVIRQVSGGLSMVSDYRGRIQCSFDFFSGKEKLWINDVKFGNVPTIYSTIGDSLAWLSVIIVGLVILFLLIELGRKQFIKKVS